MVLVLVVLLLSAGAALLTGGRFIRLADSPWQGLPWLAAAATGQLLGSLSGGSAYPVGLIGSAVCVAVFLRHNLLRPGVALLALGFLTNALVVALNGAMPVSPAALARAGLAHLPQDPRHEPAGPDTYLPWLGDVIPVTLPTIGQAVSPGDLLIAAGAGLLLYTGMGSPQHPAPAPSWDQLNSPGRANQ